MDGKHHHYFQILFSTSLQHLFWDGTIIRHRQIIVQILELR